MLINPAKKNPLAHSFEQKITFRYPKKPLTDEVEYKLFVFPKSANARVTIIPEQPYLHSFVQTKADGAKAYG